MICNKCESEMDSMGYGDMICSECGYISYSESAEDFSARTGIDITGDDDE